MKSKSIILLTSLFFIVVNARSQGYYKHNTDIPVEINGVQLSNPWVGGFNAPIFSEIDLNGDGIQDLFVFDKEGNRISTYINNGTPNQVDYVYAPEYKKKFPNNLHDWTLLKDFDCDGKADIFTYSSAGMAVYKNDYSTQNGLKFTLVHSLVMSQYGTFYANLYISPVNLPALVDVDFDGDLDVLTFPVTGNFVEFHKNRAQELYNRCDTLVFQITQNCFGNFGLSGAANEAILNVGCRMSGNSTPVDETEILTQVQHSGSCMIALDIDGDFDYDLLNGDVLGDNMLLIVNGGDSTGANMISQDPNFPSYDVPVDMYTFPAPYYFDVNNDGNKDFVTAPCINGPSENYNNIWYYPNTTNNTTNVFGFLKDRFLSDEMIEVGTGAKVVFHDLDADGLTDIVIGNHGYYSNILPFNSGLSFYKNIGTAANPRFELVTQDFGNFFSLNITDLAPAFGDIDSDGDADLMLGNSEGEIIYYSNTAGPGNLPTYALVQPKLLSNTGMIIDVGHMSVPQLIDVNRDGLIDLLIGARTGEIDYYENTGTASVPEFTLVTASFGGVIVNNSQSLYGYSYPCLVDSGGVYQLLVGAINGYIYQYNNIDNNLNGNFTLVDSMYYNIYEPSRVTVTVADINNDGVLEILTGNAAGGVAMYDYDSTSGLNDIKFNNSQFTIYPNPASEVLYIKFDSPVPLNRTVSIFDITGRMLTEESINENVKYFNISNYASGVYNCRVIENEKIYFKKFVIQ